MSPQTYIIRIIKRIAKRCAVASVAGGAPAALPGGGRTSGSSAHASSSSCIASTNAATSGVRWAAGTAWARCRRASRNSRPGWGGTVAGTPTGGPWGRCMAGWRN